jgi:hypothetical protein
MFKSCVTGVERILVMCITTPVIDIDCCTDVAETDIRIVKAGKTKAYSALQDGHIIHFSPICFN